MGQPFTPLSVADFTITKRLNNRRRSTFNDVRLHACWQALAQRMFTRQCAVVHQLADTRAQLARFYRFLKNKRVCIREMIRQNCTFKDGVVAGRHVLVLGDSTSLNVSGHRGRLQDIDTLGVLEDNTTPGFFAHVSLAVDADTHDVLGLADVLFYFRARAEQSGQRTRRTLEASAKESYKWVLGAQNSQAALRAAAKWTVVFDRDGDDFQVIQAIHTMNGHFVLRAHHDRLVDWNGQRLKLREALHQCPVADTYELDLPALDHYSSTSGKRVKRTARRARLECKYCLVHVPPPTSGAPGPARYPVYLVEATEVPSNLPPGEEPVHWILLTNHPVECADQARQILQYYCQRWVIEQLFRLLKTEGFQLEASELETAEAVLRQTVLAVQAATQVLQLVYARNRYDSQPLAEVFDPTEQAVLQRLNRKLQGTTEKQRNPFPANQTSWATWIVARLGGWKGYLSQRPPGPTTLKRGLEKFTIYVEAFRDFEDSR